MERCRRRPRPGRDDAPAWSLFTNPEALQHQMTEEVRHNVRNHYGVEIVAPVPATT
ncbi:MAG TPA: hypothetical protein VGF69_19940 [Thermoanaerobaculia bacterium]